MNRRTKKKKSARNVLVLGLTVQVLLVGSSGVELDVSTSAVKGLLVLNGVLDNEGLVLVGERRERGRGGVETEVLRGAET